ncbi:uncharacterized protein LOC127123232 [Lathyrus oleraceus]|uniref:uncharacterized protein LOC127123232 n=1 Tax=Pisum sativum TaxID=3888 RepID=UPI0021CE38ED|nr:uncharacterized protein LOC127123232 [Pisum sativum]
MCFYRVCWDFVNDDLLKVVDEFYGGARGKCYKIIAKLLVSRLKVVIPKLISKCETVFITNRQMVDGVLVLNEAMDFARREKTRCMLVKMDFENVYNCVSWDFLRSMLCSMGFGEGFHFNDNSQFDLLQFTDDTILIGEDSWDKLWTIKAFLRGFELVSGLRATASFLSCGFHFLPFVFLGIPIGMNPIRKGYWIPMVSKLKRRYGDVKVAVLGGPIQSNKVSLWWRDLCAIGNSVDSSSHFNWFSSSIYDKLGNGKTIDFWRY